MHRHTFSCHRRYFHGRDCYASRYHHPDHQQHALPGTTSITTKKAASGSTSSPNSGSAGFATNIGNYYGVGNDVIHAHWDTGGFGQVTSIEITKVGGGTFDLNYFLLTSNTALGPNKPALGNEQAYVEGFNSNVSTGPAVLLPPEGWGFPASAITLGSAFDAVDKVVFFVTNTVDCFGMDEFYINEPAPTVPEPDSITMLSLAVLSLVQSVGVAKVKRDSR